MDARDQQGEDSKSTDRGKRKMDGEEDSKTSDRGKRKMDGETCRNLKRSLPSALALLRTESTNGEPISKYRVGYVVGRNRATIGRIQQSSRAWIRIESGECTLGTYRRVHLGGTREQIQSVVKEIYDVLRQFLDRRVNLIPHHRLPEPSSYGYIYHPGLRPESQAAGFYLAHSSYYGDSSTQPSLWGPMPSPSGRHAAPSPGSLSITLPTWGTIPSNQLLSTRQTHQPMPSAPWPGSDLPSSSSANYGYPANPSTMPATSQSGICLAPLEYYTPHIVYHDPISPGFSYQANETVMRPASQPGAYPIPLFDTTNNPPTHAATQSQTTTSGMPSESSQEIIPAPQFHHNNPIQPEAGDEAYSSTMHASTSRKRQRK